MFELILDRALAKCGSSKALAIEIGKSPSEITKFRAGESGLKIEHLEKLIKISGLIIAPADKEAKLKTALKIMSELFIEEAQNNP